MGWGMWVLTFVATVAFWAIVLMSIRALFLIGGPRAERDPRATNETDAPLQRPPLRTDSSTSRTAPIEGHS